MEFIKVNKTQDVFEIRLNRPDKRNAFHPQMIRELTEAFEQANACTESKLVFLTGEGPSFCAGADLGWMKSMVDYTFEENQKDSKELFKMFETAKNCRLPVIGKVHGHVMGGALGLVAICDMAAAVAGTKFCFSEARLGLVPAVISPFVLNKMNASKARFLMITAELFQEQMAYDSGLVEFVGDEAQVDEYLSALVANIKKLGPQAVMETKKLISFVENNNWEDVREQATKVIAQRRVSDEGQARLKGFLNKA